MRYGLNNIPNYYRGGMTIFMMEYFKGKKITGVEIGTFKGHNAEVMIKALNFKKLFCIDPHKDYSEVRQGVESVKTKHYKNEMIKRLNKYENVYFIFQESMDCVDEFSDNSLDFVYIDSNKDLVGMDLFLWYPKIKNNGVIGGHDYGSSFIDAVRDINAFADGRDLELFGGRDGDWWIIKNER